MEDFRIIRDPVESNAKTTEVQLGAVHGPWFQVHLKFPFGKRDIIGELPRQIKWQDWKWTRSAE